MDKIELPSILVAKFWLILRKIMSQLLLILNNIFPFRLHNTVSIATTTPPKHIPAFDKKSSFVFDIQAASRRKHDQKIPAIFKTWKEWAHCTSGKFERILSKFWKQWILIGESTDYTACDQVEPHLRHTVVCQIDFQSDTEDGSQIRQRMGISKIV